MIDGGAVDGQTDCTSIWLVCWGPETVHGIYPKGSQMGLTVETKPQETLIDAAGGLFEGYRTHFKWDCGLTVRDWRYVVRICNIDTSTLKRDYSSGPKLVELMTSATERVADLNLGKPVFYCNRLIKSFLRNQMVNKAAYGLTFDTVAGKHVMNFDGIPVRRVDGITNTETAILDAAGSFVDM